MSLILPNNVPPTSTTPNFSPISPPQLSVPVGIIFPPADLRGIIEKTAQFVAKNGPEFESRVMREQNNQRFNFLFPNNPYRPYYELKVKEYQSGGEEVVKPAVPQAILDMREKEEEKKQRKEQLLSLTQFGQAEVELKAPEPDIYTVVHPFIAPVDIDVIKTSAQFVARNGQRFLTGLTQRERNNPQFDFLKPSHSLFGYFTSLVDAYTKCLLPPQEQLETVKTIENDFWSAFERCFSRYRWETSQEKLRKAKEDKHAEERAQMASIDWHDFVVVETIDFTTEDDQRPLAAPMDFNSAQPKRLPPPLESASMTLNGDSQLKEVPSKDVFNETEVEMDEEDMEVEMQSKPTEIAPPPASASQAEETKQPSSSIASNQPGGIKLVTGYTRGKRGASKGSVMQKCPLTGQMIPAEEMTNHLNTLLLDPRWKEEMERRKEKARKQSAFAPAEDVGSYLSAFALKRPDMFGSVEEEIKEHSDILGLDNANPTGSYDPMKGTAYETAPMLPDASNVLYATPPVAQPATGAVVRMGNATTPPMPPPILSQGSASVGAFMPPASHPHVNSAVPLPMGPPSMPMPFPVPPPVYPSGMPNMMSPLDTATDTATKRAKIDGNGDSSHMTVQYKVECLQGKVLNAHIIQIEADSTHTVKSFKKLLSTRLEGGLNHEQLEMKDNATGAVLHDDLTLQDYSLGTSSHIVLSEKI